MSFLPIRPLNEFKQGGRVTGMSEIRHEKYEGDPRPYNAEMQQQREPADIDPRAHDGLHDLASIGPSRPGSSNAAVPRTSGAETGALGGTESLPSDTVGGIHRTERDPAVGGRSGA